MDIDTTQISAFLNTVKKTYEKMPYSEYNDGVRTGIELTEAFIKTYEVIEGKRIAQHLDKGV